MNVVVVDYGMGNLRSVHKAFARIGCKAVISSTSEVINGADRLVLPGVGHFARGMDNLRTRGLLSALESRVREAKVPVLGICLGLQLMTRHSQEGDSEGLGWIDAKTVRFDFGSNKDALRIPHIGWNTLTCAPRETFLGDVPTDESFYFTHSYHLADCDPAIVAATTTYGEEFVSAIQSGNLCGTQFHPEKSHKRGLRLLRHFVEGV